MIRLALIFLFLSNTVFAINYPYQKSKDSDFRLKTNNFHRYIIPQAKSIRKDFYKILINLAPTQEQIIEIKEEIFKLNSKWKKWSLNCFDLQKSCLKTFNEIYIQSRLLDKKILSVKLSLNDKKKLFKANSIDQKLKLERALSYVSTLNYSLLHALEEIKVTSGTYYGTLNTKVSKILIPILDEMRIYIDLQIASGLPTNIKKVFYSVWENFIKRIEKHIIVDKNKNYLKTDLGELNLTWNTFHMKALKGNITLTDKMNRAITIMHSRWNSILKMIL